MDLLTLAVMCGPLVDPVLTLRIIAVESAQHAYVIHDNRSHRSVDAGNAETAIQWAQALVRAGHRIDVGLMQINVDAWLKPTGVSIAEAFDPCTNIRLGTTILSANYAASWVHSTTPAEALTKALSRYNSGSDTAAVGYAAAVLQGHAERGVSLTQRARRAQQARTSSVEFPP
jgi:type IV secretion system protein VirB1